MTEVVSDLGVLITAMPAHMSMSRHLSTTDASFVKSLSKEKSKGKIKSVKRGLTIAET
jgi:hypothetical protein